MRESAKDRLYPEQLTDEECIVTCGISYEHLHRIVQFCQDDKTPVSLLQVHSVEDAFSFPLIAQVYRLYMLLRLGSSHRRLAALVGRDRSLFSKLLKETLPIVAKAMAKRYLHQSLDDALMETPEIIRELLPNAKMFTDGARLSTYCFLLLITQRQDQLHS